MIYQNKEIPKLGFGLMRLPMIDSEIDIEQTKDMVDLFLEEGFTYFDTAYGYLNQRSEGAAKIALVDRHPRESFQLATKLPAWNAATAEDAKQMFFTSLERAGVEYFDFYLLHNLGGTRTTLFEEWKIWEFVEEQKAQGRIKNLGFSIHDGAKALEDVLTKHPSVDFVQLQLNYADWHSTVVQSKACYEVATSHKVPIIVMEPIRGGALANPPAELQEIFKAENPDMPFAVWALKYVAGLDNIVTVLSGMSTIEQMRENIQYMKHMTALTSSEQVAVEKAQKALENIPSIPCTVCRYCEKDCPKNILIPDIFSAMNKKLIYGDAAGAKGSYHFVTRDVHEKKGAKASDCVACGKCETVCPQYIHIIEELQQIAQSFDS